MSIDSEMTRIENNVDDALSAVSEYGVEVASESNSDNLGTLIRAIPKANIVQTTGESATDVMSQAAVTAELEKKLSADGGEVSVFRLVTDPSAGSGRYVSFLVSDEDIELVSSTLAGEVTARVGLGPLGLELDGLVEPSTDDMPTTKKYVDELVATMQEEISTVPEYWQDYLRSKIDGIRALHDEAGKDCFSFVLMTDLHYTQNLGKISPLLAKEIMDACDIRFALALGDFQNRGQWGTKAEAITEFENVKAMLEPILDCVLMEQGNHDGSWGATLNGVTYPYNFTPEELYTLIFAPTYKHQNAVTDESGTAYYMDDPARKVRYILLNTHCNEYALNDDGSAMYNNMRTFRFTQNQYDFLINKALVLEDGWSVVVAAHAPINNAYGEAFGDSTNTTGDHIIMRNLLKAFKNKTTYSGAWDGTAGGSAGSGGYTNLFDTSGDGFSDSGSKFYTNWLPYSSVGDGTAYHFKGLKSDSGYVNPYKMQFKTAAGTTSAQVYCTNANVQAGVTADYDSSVTIVQHDTNVGDATGSTEYIYVQFEIREALPDNLIITADEEIVESSGGSEGGYDAVAVDADFTNAPGEFVAYFSGHMHADYHYKASDGWGVDIITTRCDSANENNADLLAERVEGTTTEQCFDVFTVNTKTRTIHATRIGAGDSRTISY